MQFAIWALFFAAAVLVLQVDHAHAKIYNVNSRHQANCNMVTRLSEGESFVFDTFPPPMTFGYSGPPRECTWAFQGVGSCFLELDVSKYEQGDIDCAQQYFIIGDEHRERRICGFGKPPRHVRSTGQQLFVTHVQANAFHKIVEASEIGGVIRCRKIPGADARVQATKGLPGIKCVAKYAPGKLACDDGNCDFTNPGHVFKLACETDCQEQHGSPHGYCMPHSDMCICDPVSIIPPQPLQCLNISNAEQYELICETDCKCTHNAIGGKCDFVARACKCWPTYMHQSPSELGCPYKTGKEYVLSVITRYAAMGINVVELLTSS